MKKVIKTEGRPGANSWMKASFKYAGCAAPSGPLPAPITPTPFQASTIASPVTRALFDTETQFDCRLWLAELLRAYRRRTDQ